MKDSIFNDEKSNNMSRLQNAHDMAQKQNEINLLNNEQKRQTQLLYFMGVSLFLVLLAVAALYKAFDGKKKSNRILQDFSEKISTQNEVLELQKTEMAAQAVVLQKTFTEISAKNSLIEEKNKNITASIRYAQRIQEAVLPKTEDIKAFLNKNMSLWQMITQKSTVILVDFDDDLNKKQILVVAVSELPNTYLPSEKSYFQEEQYQPYASELKNQLDKKEWEKCEKHVTLQVEKQKLC